MGRLNTVRISYGSLPNKPSLGKVQTFCLKELGLQKGQVLRFQNSRALGVTFVTVTDLGLAREIVNEHGDIHYLTGSDGKEYPLTITLEDGAVDVKVYDLSEDVTNLDLYDFLSKYGEVRGIREEKLAEDQEFAGAFTGVRIARMVVRQNIDSWITINGELTQLTYFGQRQTCRHCRDFLHIGATCVQNKKLTVQKSYADAAKQPAKPNLPNQGGKNPNKPTKPQGPNKPQGPANPKGPNQPQGPSKPQGANKPQGLSNDQAPQPIKPTPRPRSPTKPINPNSSAPVPQQPDLPVGPPFLKPLSPNPKQPETGSQNRLKSDAGKFDGSDTDSSVASSVSSRRSSRGRPPGKKPRSGQNEQEEDELI